MSIESIAQTQPSAGAGVDACAACGALLDEDQRYCLQCGERRAPLSSVLLGGLPAQASSLQAAPPLAPAPPLSPPPDAGSGRGSAVTVIAGVGVLLLAMGVGVLIGRSGASKPSAAPAQVISVAPAPGAAQGSAATPAASAASFSDDWPAGLSGYTVQLQTLPQASTQVSAVQAAKAAASAKGAKHVGALKSEDFASLQTGNFVVYSGEYHKRAAANKALVGLRKSFPGAKVVKVSSTATGSSPGAGSSSPSSSPTTGAGSSESHPASPGVVEKLKKVKSGSKSYEQESKNLPNVISTG